MFIAWETGGTSLSESSILVGVRDLWWHTTTSVRMTRFQLPLQVMIFASCDILHSFKGELLCDEAVIVKS